jgi:hypothetical protein
LPLGLCTILLANGQLDLFEGLGKNNHVGLIGFP